MKTKDNKNKQTLNLNLEFEQIKWKMFNKKQGLDLIKCNAKMTTIRFYVCIVQLLFCKTLEPCSMKWTESMSNEWWKQGTRKANDH
jgi:hypothetical protein